MRQMRAGKFVMSILITGGAGYIGSHMVHAALERGLKVVVLDDLSTGMRAAVADGAHFHQGHVGDQAVVRRLINEHKVSAVIHFAGSLIAPDSVKEPLTYYFNNTVASRSLIEACVLEGVKQFVFSSTALVYGPPPLAPMPETTSKVPDNPYGRSKLMTEWILEDTSRAHDFRYAALRYFNVAGADPKGRTGQSTARATHLIKRACQVALGRVPRLEIFGTDYPTPDGTGVRDYIHVSDLVDAHLLALDYLASGGKSVALNCGYGRGLSVREVIRAVSRVVGRELPVIEAPRRPGDPPALIADATRLITEFGWRPKHDDLEQIIGTAYEWERRLNFA
jgi:UDP-glucose 4-epimerase